MQGDSSLPNFVLFCLFISKLESDNLEDGLVISKSESDNFLEDGLGVSTFDNFLPNGLVISMLDSDIFLAGNDCLFPSVCLALKKS